MKLKPVIKKELRQNFEKQQKMETPSKKETPKKNTKKENKLPPDEYTPMFPPVRILVRETPSKKDGKTIRQYLELTVKRFDDDEAQPNVWIQMYQESDFYTGYLKGKTVYLPLWTLCDLIDGLTDLNDECEKRGIEQCDINTYTGAHQKWCALFVFLCV